MSKVNQKVKADQKATRTANQTALKGFPKGKLRAAFEAMASEKENGDAAAEQRQNQALAVVKLAHDFRSKQPKNVPLDTIVAGWRDNMALVAMELAVAGNKFAELSEATKDKPARAKLTGYGNNVASIAKGLIQHELEPEETYRDTRKAVQAARAEARRAGDPELAALEDSKADCDDAWKELRKAVFGTEHTVLIQSLGDLLKQAHADLMARPEANTAEADEAEEAEPEEEQKKAA